MSCSNLSNAILAFEAIWGNGNFGPISDPGVWSKLGTSGHGGSSRVTVKTGPPFVTFTIGHMNRGCLTSYGGYDHSERVFLAVSRVGRPGFQQPKG